MVVASACCGALQCTLQSMYRAQGISYPATQASHANVCFGSKADLMR